MSMLTELIHPHGRPEGSPTSDLAQWLPPAGRRTLQSLRRARVDARSALDAVTEEINDKRMTLQRLEGHARRLVGHGGDAGFNLKGDDPRVATLNEQITAAKRELAELQSIYDQRSATRAAMATLIGNCERVIAEQVAQLNLSAFNRGGRTLPEFSGRLPKIVEKGEAVTDAVRRIRERVAQISELIDETIKAPVASSELRAVVLKGVEELAGRGKPTITGDGCVKWTTSRVDVPVYLTAPQRDRSPLVDAIDGGGSAPVTDAAALVAWLLKDTLVQRLVELLPKDRAPGLSTAERTQRLQKLRSEKLELERCECGAIAMAREQHIEIAHRADVDVCALLILE